MPKPVPRYWPWQAETPFTPEWLQYVPQSGIALDGAQATTGGKMDPFARPTVIDARDRPSESWDDAARGTLRWRMLISAPVTATAGLVCGVAEMAEGDHFAPHRHAEPEVYFGLDGEGVVVIDGAAHRLAPGVAIYIPSMAEHGVPTVSGPLRWFYTFACDGFAQIAYQFTHEDPETGQRQA